MVHQQTKVLEWDAREFEYTKKSRDWYWALGALSVVGLALTIIFGNYLLAVFIALSTFLIVLYASKKPDDIHVEISDQGVRVKQSLFPYTNLESFWITPKEDQQSLLLLRVNRLVDPLQIIPISDDVDLTDLREWFLSHLPEEEMREPIAHRISDRLGF